MVFNLEISSKNLYFIKNFEFFLHLLKKKLKIKLSVIKLIKPTKKKVFSILKSPHINKTAQEQFQQKNHKRLLKIYCVEKAPRCIYIIKLLKKRLFPGIRLNFKIFSTKYLHLVGKVVNPNNYIIKQKKEKINIKTVSYMKIMDIYGETLFR